MSVIIKLSSPDYITENLNKTDNENLFKIKKVGCVISTHKMFGFFQC